MPSWRYFLHKIEFEFLLILRELHYFIYLNTKCVISSVRLNIFETRYYGRLTENRQVFCCPEGRSSFPLSFRAAFPESSAASRRCSSSWKARWWSCSCRPTETISRSPKLFCRILHTKYIFRYRSYKKIKILIHTKRPIFEVITMKMSPAPPTSMTGYRTLTRRSRKYFTRTVSEKKISFFWIFFFLNILEKKFG